MFWMSSRKHMYTLTHTHTRSRSHSHTHTHTHKPHAVSAFSYYQFYCFQNTEDIFNRFNTNSSTLTEFLNETEAIANRLCVQTEVFRTFISSQLPWFRYQKETWLAVGEIHCIYMYMRTCTFSLILSLSSPVYRFEMLA